MKRTIQLVGGPLHGESREVEDSRSHYNVSDVAAGGVITALAGEGSPHSRSGPMLTYARRRDGRYWLEVQAPSVVQPVAGFTFRWYDEGRDGMLLCEVEAPKSDWGHAQVDVSISEELLADSPALASAGGVLGLVIESIRQRERRVARRVDLEDVLAFASSIEAGDEVSMGNRRILAAWLRLYVEQRSRG